MKRIQPEYSLTMTKLGAFRCQSQWTLLRFDPPPNGLARVQGYPRCGSPVHELSDGRLYSSRTPNWCDGFNGGAARGCPWEIPDGSSAGLGLGKISEVGSIWWHKREGWKCRGILRCPGMAQQGIGVPAFLKACGLPDHLPFPGGPCDLAEEPRSALRAMAVPLRNPALAVDKHRLPGDLGGSAVGRPLQPMVLWTVVVFTNGLGGFTWEGPYARGLVGGFTRKERMAACGIAQPEAEWGLPC